MAMKNLKIRALDVVTPVPADVRQDKQHSERNNGLKTRQRRQI